jgi:hypothetical protein
MTAKRRTRGWLVTAGAAGLTVLATIVSGAGAQQSALESVTVEVRSVDLRTAPQVPPAPRPAGLAINRPTMPMADYVAAKNAAAAMRVPGQSRPGAAATSAPPVSSGVTLFTQVGSTNETQTTGGNQFPPDGDVATSAEWLVQVNEDVVVMYNWLTNAFTQTKLSTLFQTSDFLFDPRVIYDPYWDRFVVTAAACLNCGTLNNASLLAVAVTKTNDPTGSYWIAFPKTSTNGSFTDFPQLGMDLNSLILTYNIFAPGGTFLAPFVSSVAKATLYNGLASKFFAFSFGGVCTIAPPFVLDLSSVDYLLSFCPGDTKVSILSLINAGLQGAQLNLDNTVDVSGGIPPAAKQPGTDYTLDTGDNRFENRSLQIGSRIINTATVNFANFPTPRLYNFNIGVSPHTLVSQQVYFASSHSNDWHPAINANTVGAPSGTPLGEIFATWMSTDPPAGTNVQLRAGGWIGDSPAGPISGIPVFTSAIPLTNQTDAAGIHQTGHYAYIALYPAAALGCQANEIGILEGETAGPSAGLWGTHIGIVKHC